MHEDFQEIVSGFQQFLKQNSIPDNIIWVAPEHIIHIKKKWLVYQGEGVDEADIMRAYEQTRKAARGVCMYAICHNEENTWCALHTPVDEEQEAYQPLVNGNVHYSVSLQPGGGNAVATLIKRTLISHWYEWRGKRHREMKLRAFGY